MNNTVNDKINAMRLHCKPLGVNVQLKKQRDRYYVKLFCKFHESQNWAETWGGFNNFAKFQVRPHFPKAQLTSCGTDNATFFIGTLFDFIKQ